MKPIALSRSAVVRPRRVLALLLIAVVAAAGWRAHAALRRPSAPTAAPGALARLADAEVARAVAAVTTCRAALDERAASVGRRLRRAGAYRYALAETELWRSELEAFHAPGDVDERGVRERLDRARRALIAVIEHLEQEPLGPSTMAMCLAAGSPPATLPADCDEVELEPLADAAHEAELAYLEAHFVTLLEADVSTDGRRPVELERAIETVVRARQVRSPICGNHGPRRIPDEVRAACERARDAARGHH